LKIDVEMKNIKRYKRTLAELNYTCVTA
jgi:hypothetical protein